MLAINLHSSSALTDDADSQAEETVGSEEMSGTSESAPSESASVNATEPTVPETSETSDSTTDETVGSDNTETNSGDEVTNSDNTATSDSSVSGDQDASSSATSSSGAASSENTGASSDANTGNNFTNDTNNSNSSDITGTGSSSNDSEGNVDSSDTENNADASIGSDTKDDADATVDTENNSTTDSDNETSDNTTSDSTSSESTNDSSESSASQESLSKPNLSTQETVTVNPDKKVTDTKKDAVYIQPTYTPSGFFIADEDKIKYNVALPIDNIPSFITQEMIIAALKCQDETGFPASVTIAQIIQESGFGKYGPGGDDRQGLSYLAFQYCNLFGIKGTGPAGSVNMKTGEQAASGEYYSINAGFRVYNTYTECIEDRTDILKRVYKDLTKGVTDANTFAMKIGSRWATSHTYGQNLITQMKRYDLYRLDEMTLQDFSQMIGTFANPCPGSYKTSSFGYREFDSKFHKGVDFGTNGEEIPTYAAEAGTVVVAGYNSSAGNWIVIDHGNGLVTKYMHHSKIFVVKGQEVEKGQQIGLTGNTGRSSGVHLHFQVEENGVAVDPEAYLYEDTVSE